MRRGRPWARGEDAGGDAGGRRGARRGRGEVGRAPPPHPGRRHLLHWRWGRSPPCCRFYCRPRHWARGSRWPLGEPAWRPQGPRGPRRKDELLSGPAASRRAGWDAEGQETPLCSSAAAGASSVSTVSALLSPPLPPDSPPLPTSAEPGSRLFVRDEEGGGAGLAWK